MRVLNLFRVSSCLTLSIRPLVSTSIGIRSMKRSFSTISTWTPIQLGLTGSIGMGKSTISDHFRFLGFPVFDADAAVHQLYSKNGAAVEPIKSMFPDAIVDDSVDRVKLSVYVLNNQEALKNLEAIVHPLVAKMRKKFLQDATEQGHFLVVYDIPLLLENRSAHEVDYILVATADAKVQKERVLSRPGMTLEKFESILSKQIPDEEKRKLAQFIVHTDIEEGYAAMKSQVAKVIEKLIDLEPEKFEKWKTRPSLMKSDSSIPFDVVAFDLDDTLVPCLPAILAAREEKWNYMAEKMPKTYPSAKNSLQDLMTSHLASHPHLAHDYRSVRAVALKSLAIEHDEHHLVDEAVDVFESKRSEVEKYLFSDTMPCLDYFRSKGIKCCILSNGSAMLHKCISLSRSLEFSMNAADIGAMKPSILPFMSLSLRTNVVPSRILYIGDSYENDTVGAKKAGMVSALITRPPTESSIEHSIILNTQAHGGVFPSGPPDIELTSLLPSEIEAKVKAFLGLNDERT